MPMPGTGIRLAGPAYLGNAAANIYTPPASTMMVYIYHIHIVNTDSQPNTYTLYIGATGGSTGGTEIAKTKPVQASGTDDLYFPDGLPMKSTDFLTGLASVASKVTITVIGEQVVIP